MRKKSYQPPRKYNKIEQAKRIDKLKMDIENHGKTIEAISKSHDNHISYLGNFARHDIKNAMLSMDSIVSTTEPQEFTSEKIASITTYVEIVMETIDNFAKLIPYKSEGYFTAKSLIVAVELLSRSDMKKNGIELILNFDRNNETKINHPFQAVLQMINNLILNSIISLDGVENKRIELESQVIDDNLIIFIKDNGNSIPEDHFDKIFDYGFSTTGGSGIGLHHARYLCDIFKGEIKLNQASNSNFNKSFEIKLPCKKLH